MPKDHIFTGKNDIKDDGHRHICTGQKGLLLVKPNQLQPV